ncbi:hypothetical protein [Bdellovibrio sp. HCB-162]|uniref:hypothetical protein n=1 Tax=Bdellovibrio sp. HCB-162 TaxID=3394234 RepID=UPI0039BCAB58
MSTTLIEEFKKHHDISPDGTAFLTELETSIGKDLWLSAGGHWAEISIAKFRRVAMEKLAAELRGNSVDSYKSAWTEVVRDFHDSFWGEHRLAKKEKKPRTEEQIIFWELFSYIWILLQALFIVKTLIFYLGLKSAQEGTTDGKISVALAILFSFVSLGWFAYRKSKNSKKD